MGDRPVPLTVIGGYLGAGKTTMLNRLLAEPGGRRLGVVVNDFGELAIDALLLGAAGVGDIVSLPNGCVCCTLGADLRQTLVAMLAGPTPPDQIVIEVSGVADPAATAAWGTVPPFAPGGVIVLAAADAVRRQADDRYVGGEVRRQLAGADLVVVTKPDLVIARDRQDVEAWCARVAGGAPVVCAERGSPPIDVVLGQRPADVADGVRPVSHEDDYVRLAWSSSCATSVAALRRVLDELPVGVLRMKGFVAVESGAMVGIDVVGRTREIRSVDAVGRSTSAVVAIGHRATFDPVDLRRRLDVLGVGLRG